MNTLQTLGALVMLIWLLSVIVQFINDWLKALLGTKAEVMKQTIDKFMGPRLPLPEVEKALKLRGLDITALENFSREGFRDLLDGMTLPDQWNDIVTSAEASLDQIKDNIAASYEAVRACFQNEYTKRNKLIVMVLSFLVVIALNANIIILYEEIAADQVAQQTIMGQAIALNRGQQVRNVSDTSQQTDLAAAYVNSREQIDKVLQKYPILIRTTKYKEDYDKNPFFVFFGLCVMGLLVSLGAPFWNDVLKGITGVNTTLNAGAGKTVTVQQTSAPSTSPSLGHP